MDIIRVLIHGITFLLGGMGLHWFASHTGNHTLQAISSVISWASYVPFAAAASSALHEHKIMMLAVTGITVLLGEPGSLQECSQQLCTIGAGLLTGTAIRRIIAPERKTDDTPTPE